MNYRERIRKAIECPQFGNERYGEWGALNLEKRILIKRLLDELDRADNYVKRLYLGNQELKKQLEEKKMLIKQCDLSISKVMDCYCERTDCSGRIKDSKQYDSLVQKVETQQKEFINYLEDEIHTIETTYSQINGNYGLMNEKLETLKEILQKYKKIIGVLDEKE